jgi:hypothetical protein
MGEYSPKEAKSRRGDDQETLSAQFARMDKKLSVLVLLISLQTLLLAAMMLAYLIPQFLFYFQVGLVMAGILSTIFFFRKQIPGWLGSASRKLFSTLGSGQRKDNF